MAPAGADACGRRTPQKYPPALCKGKSDKYTAYQQGPPGDEPDGPGVGGTA